MSVKVIPLIADKIQPYLESIAKLRIQCFREFPYLYEGSLEYEEAYLKEFSEDKNALLLLIQEGENIVGFSSGIPLNSKCDIVKTAQDLFLQNNLDPKEYFYFGELIILPNYRDVQSLRVLSKQQDTYASGLGFSRACFLTVMRDENDPRKPKNYRSLEPIWRYNGYERMQLYIRYPWPTIQSDGSVIEQENTLEFWEKTLPHV